MDLVKISYDNFLVRKNRTVRIWTPTSYSEEEEPFDVIYMFDGSNLFDEATAFVHKEWQIDETIESLKGEIRPCVVVGIDASND
ncbi:MAG: alpha/beta hydrolase-fold protein, partial [Bacilli bacterium]|nr:alpha/beta hydrolase-fold protein [Bacilli bacterium]